MQSHTYMTLWSLSFRCDSNCLEAVGSLSLSCLVYRRPLPVLVSLECYINRENPRLIMDLGFKFDNQVSKINVMKEEMNKGSKFYLYELMCFNSIVRY
jgi:hypothetical protein